MPNRSRIANVPVRAATGAFILNSGVGKLTADQERAANLHAMASATYPVLKQVPPERFTKALAVAEVALGGALMAPTLNDGLAGLALTAFAGGLMGLYLKTPGMRADNSLRPTPQGTALAKDTWLLGIGLSLVGHSLGARRQARQRSRRQARQRSREGRTARSTTAAPEAH